MSKMSNKEINIYAAKYAGFRVLAVILVIALNWVLVFKLGWDIRNWQWWTLSPALSFTVAVALAWLAEQ